jgi:hypothetical protein
MKRALLALALALSAAGCAQQDAALLVTFSGAWRIPADGDRLVVDVSDQGQVISHSTYALQPQTPLSATLTLVQAGKGHPHVRIRAQLVITTGAAGGTTAIGQTDADFQSGRTTPVTVTLVPSGGP